MLQLRRKSDSRSVVAQVVSRTKEVNRRSVAPFDPKMSDLLAKRITLVGLFVYLCTEPDSKA
ncbi:hypothetical protein T02_8365 [Trichinella nativa]|uniref:Uncharacterized protein n=1 Tax=Trichinella nativa TaxID=6335 RepID=A0A0V1KQ02_9BILA|nr:hypothetical protein T02_8365 [Trichinella nativa]